VSGAYSENSSHIFLGDAENRMLLDFGVSYNRRLRLNHVVNWQYSAELVPVALESDPVLIDVSSTTTTSTTPPGLPETIILTSSNPIVGACHPASGSGTFSTSTYTYSYTFVDTCTRRWTIGEAMSPIGFEWNFLPHHTRQPFATAHGGYMYTTQPIPVTNAGSFNFTFDFGAGVELYRSRTRSIRAEGRFHHISNNNTATANPGIDNLLFQVTYVFGRQ